MNVHSHCHSTLINVENSIQWSRDPLIAVLAFDVGDLSSMDNTSECITWADTQTRSLGVAATLDVATLDFPR
jgi:hypothetical protein